MNDDHNICLKTEVAIECAAGITGFIFRNYDLNHITCPPDIQEIYDRNSRYSQSLFSLKTESELDEVLESIQRDRDYVKAHTPLPHR